MKKTKYIISLLTLLLLFPYTTYADCSEEIEYFKEHEDEYKVTYEYDRENENYDIILFTPDDSPFSYIIDTEIDYSVARIDNNTKACGKFPAGEYNIMIFGKTESCDRAVKEITIKLPKPNKYYGNPLCEGIEEFVLCQETYDKEIDYDTFVSRVELYKSSKQEEEPEIEKKDNLDKVMEYIENNIFQIIIVITFAITLIITLIITVKNIRKSRRLEWEKRTIPLNTF